MTKGSGRVRTLSIFHSIAIDLWWKKSRDVFLIAEAFSFLAQELPITLTTARRGKKHLSPNWFFLKTPMLE